MKIIEMYREIIKNKNFKKMTTFFDKENIIFQLKKVEISKEMDKY